MTCMVAAVPTLTRTATLDSPLDTTTTRTKERWQWKSKHEHVRSRILRLIYQYLLPRYTERPSCRLAQQVEKSLFLRAYSLKEYEDVATLTARIHQAVLVAVQTWKRRRSEVRSQLPTDKNNDPNSRHPTPRWTRKEETPAWKEQRSKTPTVPTRSAAISSPWMAAIVEESTLFCSNQQDVLPHIYSFLSFPELVQHRRLNRWARCMLPQWVKSLHLSSKTFCDLFSMPSTAPHGTVYSKIEEIVVDADVPVRYHLHAEMAVCRLAQLIQNGTLVHLRRLEIPSLFVNSKTWNGIGALVWSLSPGRCPRLATLNIAANCIGDYGAVQIAHLLTSAGGQSLRKLNMSTNFIGQRGAEALARALQSSPMELETLELMNNAIPAEDRMALLNAVVGSGNETRLHLDSFRLDPVHPATS